jgi:hypothetical protein
LKLRLRGKGSGYKEGPDQMESDENLHLCVSAKDEKLYKIACKNVEKLLSGIYSDFAQYTKDNGREVALQMKKVDLNSQSNNLSQGQNQGQQNHHYYENIS